MKSAVTVVIKDMPAFIASLDNFSTKNFAYTVTLASAFSSLHIAETALSPLSALILESMYTQGAFSSFLKTSA